VLPRRDDLPGDRGVLIVAYASHKKKSYSFFLLQVRVGLCVWGEGGGRWFGLGGWERWIVLRRCGE